MIALLLADRCTACQRCVDACPRNVFEPAAAGSPPTIARAEDCQTCFQCELYCQADALYVEPTVDALVPVDEAQVRASGLLGVFRRDSGWDEWQGDPRFANQQWRMEEVFARGRALHLTTTITTTTGKSPMTHPRELHFGLILHGTGAGWGDWRHPQAHPKGSIDIALYQHQARLAEAGRFDFLFVADSVHINERSSPHYLNRFEPLTILSALATSTTHIGLVGTVTVSYSEPYTVARQFASLDHISGGRAGWNVVTSWLSGSAANYGKPEHPPHAVRYGIAAEHLQVVQGLWDSWEDDAIVANRETGQFFDPAKLHALNHQGTHFSVAGPLNIMRSRQGQPVIFQAGASDDGRNFAARHADAIFAGGGNFDDARSYRADLRRRAAGFGRDADTVAVLPGLRTIVGRDKAEVEDKYRQALSLVRIEEALPALGRSFNDHDFSHYPLDAPFPDMAALGAESNRSASERIVKLARSENLTLRQTALRVLAPRDEFVGTPVQVADAIQRWFEQGAADGFIFGQVLPGDLDDFVNLVVPILQERGLVRREYAADTLRGHLGLAVPENRYTAARGVAANTAGTAPPIDSALTEST